MTPEEHADAILEMPIVIAGQAYSLRTELTSQIERELLKYIAAAIREHEAEVRKEYAANKKRDKLAHMMREAYHI